MSSDDVNPADETRSVDRAFAFAGTFEAELLLAEFYGVPPIDVDRAPDPFSMAPTELDLDAV